MDTKGLRVVRGPNWKWDDQDFCEGGVGTVISSNIKGDLLEKLALGLYRIKIENDTKQPRQIDGFVRVLWDNGRVADYLACDEIRNLRVCFLRYIFNRSHEFPFIIFAFRFLIVL